MTRKQCARSRKRSLRFIKSGKWFKEFVQAEKENDQNMMELLYFQWGLDDSLKQWAQYRLAVVRGERQEIQPMQRLKELSRTVRQERELADE
ncbi:hypothetical protein MOF08_07730 [Bacillus licheniformis]|uniref:hypothetical protein n=1 Tax=Bacillus licheniformis TaxID=1402 RepID=UPI002280F6B4|nr:hypothetical protein [Bacillus licheniformis]MCY9220606.1 hypothetical protein [Bacillus licheniformis]